MKPLFKILHRSMLVNSLIPLLIIEIALLLLYFGINHYSSTKNQQILLDQVLTSVEQTNQYKAYTTTLTLNEVNHLTRIVHSAQLRFFETLEDCDISKNSTNYRVHENGVFYKPIDNGGASLYVSSSTELTEEVRKKAICSEALDPVLKQAVEHDLIVTQAYLNTRDDLVRIYPFIDNIPDRFGPSLKLENFNFYYEADYAHNPLGETVWTSAYLDPAGQGWMVSAIFPIYQNGLLEAVGGLDITLDNFIQDILDIQLPEYATAIMLDGKGTLLAMPAKAEALVGLKEVTNKGHHDLVNKTIEKPAEFNIIDNRTTDFSTLYHQLTNSQESHAEGMINNKPYIIFADIIEYTNWQLIILIDKQQALKPIAEMQSLTTYLGWIAVLMVYFFYSLFFVYVKVKSAKLSSAVARPLEALSEQTKSIRNFTPIGELPQTEIQEVYQLTKNFYTMQSALQTQTRELIGAEVKQRLMEQEKELLKRMVNTDPLTNIANRLKIEQALEDEVKMFKRYEQPFSIILIDIDFFKIVNDTYGHDIGDQVLVQCVKVLQQNLRNTDLLGRWGGEEFIAVCRHSSLSNSTKAAENLRVSIEQARFSTKHKITISLGIAGYEDNVSISQLIDRADQALYRAKQRGRNQCVAFEVEQIRLINL